MRIVILLVLSLILKSVFIEILFSGIEREE